MRRQPGWEGRRNDPTTGGRRSSTLFTGTLNLTTIAFDRLNFYNLIHYRNVMRGREILEFLSVLNCHKLTVSWVPPDRSNVGNAGGGAFWRCLLQRLR